METTEGVTIWTERMRVKVGDNLAIVSCYVMKWERSTEGYI